MFDLYADLRGATRCMLAILPNYFSASFKHVISPPVLMFPMPPLAPLPPTPHEPSPQPGRGFANSSVTLDSSHKTSSFLTAPSEEALDHQTSPTQSVSPRYPPSPLRPITQESYCCPPYAIAPSNASHTSIPTSTSSASAHGPVHPALAEQGDTVEIGGEEAYALYNMRSLNEIDDHTLFVHLYHAAGIVRGVKEAMWEELKALVERFDESLAQYGWRPDEYTESESRKKFEFLWDRYRTCALLPCTLSHWPD